MPEVDANSILQPPQPRVQTPPGTQTLPTEMELQQMYNWSNALRNNQQPVRSWTQGVSNMVNALMGGYLHGQAARLGRVPGAAKLNSTGATIPPPANFAPDDIESAPSTKTGPQEGALNSNSEGASNDL